MSKQGSRSFSRAFKLTAIERLAAGESASAIRELNRDEQVELVALTWLGRGSFTAGHWQEAVAEARKSMENQWGQTRLISRRWPSINRL